MNPSLEALIRHLDIPISSIRITQESDIKTLERLIRQLHYSYNAGVDVLKLRVSEASPLKAKVNALRPLPTYPLDTIKKISDIFGTYLPPELLSPSAITSLDNIEKYLHRLKKQIKSNGKMIDSAVAYNEEKAQLRLF